MSFRLIVKFSGLCEYFRHEDKLGIIMPDARKPRRKDDDPERDEPILAKDLTPLVWHVGYLRYNLADSGASVPAERKDLSPEFEVIHRFDCDELDFGLPDAPFHACDTGMPDAADFAPETTPVPGLFSPTPPTGLLMRTIISGGIVSHKLGKGLWRFSNHLNPDVAQQSGGKHYAADMIWARDVDQDELVLALRDWTQEKKTQVTLKPREPGGTIELKIANLCADNPLEWSDLYTRVLELKYPVYDNDFKWFYQLWNNPGDFSQFKMKGMLLPVPEMIEGSTTGEKGGPAPDDCTGHTRKYDFMRDRISKEP